MFRSQISLNLLKCWFRDQRAWGSSRPKHSFHSIKLWQIIKESDKAHNLRTKLQNDNKRVEEIMNERQRAYDLKLEEMRKELEGAQQAADKKLAEVRAQCDHEIAKYRVSILSSKQ